MPVANYSTTPMLTIRLADPSDAVTMMQVHRESVFAKAANCYPQAELEEWAPGPTPDRVERVEREINDPQFIVLVAEAASELIGFGMAVPAKNDLRALYVKPNSVERVGQQHPRCTRDNSV